MFKFVQSGADGVGIGFGGDGRIKLLFCRIKLPRKRFFRLSHGGGYGVGKLVLKGGVGGDILAFYHFIRLTISLTDGLDLSGKLGTVRFLIYQPREFLNRRIEIGLHIANRRIKFFLCGIYHTAKPFVHRCHRFDGGVSVVHRIDSRLRLLQFLRQKKNTLRMQLRRILQFVYGALQSGQSVFQPLNLRLQRVALLPYGIKSDAAIRHSKTFRREFSVVIGKLRFVVAGRIAPA